MFDDRGQISGLKEDIHVVSAATSEQLVDRHVEGLPLDIPQGDIDGGNRRADDAVGGIESAPEHLLPEIFNSHGILADEPLFHVLDGPDDGLPASLQAGFADAGQTFIRGHNDGH